MCSVASPNEYVRACHVAPMGCQFVAFSQRPSSVGFRIPRFHEWRNLFLVVWHAVCMPNYNGSISPFMVRGMWKPARHVIGRTPQAGITSVPQRRHANKRTYTDNDPHGHLCTCICMCSCTDMFVCIFVKVWMLGMVLGLKPCPSVRCVCVARTAVVAVCVCVMGRHRCEVIPTVVRGAARCAPSQLLCQPVTSGPLWCGVRACAPHGRPPAPHDRRCAAPSCRTCNTRAARVAHIVRRPSHAGPRPHHQHA